MKRNNMLLSAAAQQYLVHGKESYTSSEMANSSLLSSMTAEQNTIGLGHLGDSVFGMTADSIGGPVVGNTVNSGPSVVMTQLATTATNLVDVHIKFSEPMTELKWFHLKASTGSIMNIKNISPTESIVTVRTNINIEGNFTLGIDSTFKSIAGSQLGQEQAFQTHIDSKIPVMNSVEKSYDPTTGIISMKINFSEEVIGFDDPTKFNPTYIGPSTDLPPPMWVSPWYTHPTPPPRTYFGEITKIDGKTYVYTYQTDPGSVGEMKFSIRNTNVTDKYGNKPIDFVNAHSVEYNNSPLFANISRSEVDAANNLVKGFVVFTNDVVGFDESDLIVSGGRLVSMVKHVAHSYEVIVEVEPNSKGNVHIQLTPDTFKSVSGKTLEPFNTTKGDFEYNLTKPVATVTHSTIDPKTGEMKVTVAFDQSVSGFSASSISVKNGSVVMNKTVRDGDTWIFTIDAHDNKKGLLEVSVDTSKAVGDSGIPAGTSEPYTIFEPFNTMIFDAKISFEKMDQKTGEIVALFDFTRNVDKFDINNFTVTNATVKNITRLDGDTYAATLVVPLGTDKRVTVDLNESTVVADNGDTIKTNIYGIQTTDLVAPKFNLWAQFYDAKTGTGIVRVGFVEDVVFDKENPIIKSNIELQSMDLISSGTRFAQYSFKIPEGSKGILKFELENHEVTDKAGNEAVGTNTASVAYSLPVSVKPNSMLSYDDSTHAVELDYTHVSAFKVTELSFSGAAFNSGKRSVVKYNDVFLNGKDDLSFFIPKDPDGIGVGKETGMVINTKRGDIVDLATAPNTIGWVKTDKTLFLANSDNQVSANHNLWMNQHTNMGLWIHEDTTVI